MHPEHWLEARINAALSWHSPNVALFDDVLHLIAGPLVGEVLGIQLSCSKI